MSIAKLARIRNRFNQPPVYFAFKQEPRSDSSTARPRAPFAQLTRTWRIRHDTSGVRATWEFKADQIQNGSLSGYCERINSSSRLDSRPAALLTLLIPSPPLWNSLDCRGLVPPKSGVLTLCFCVYVCVWYARPLLGGGGGIGVFSRKRMWMLCKAQDSIPDVFKCLTCVCAHLISADLWLPVLCKESQPSKEAPRGGAGALGDARSASTDPFFGISFSFRIFPSDSPRRSPLGSPSS